MLSDEQRAALAARLRQNRRQVEQEQAAPEGCRLVDLTLDASRPPLFAFHAIGGSVYAYAHLARELAGQYRFIGVEAAGLVAGSTPTTRLEDMIAHYTDAIRHVQPVGPYRLLGWSMGGQIAFETARRLEGLGEQVETLALLDAPFMIVPHMLTSPEELETLFVADVGSTLGWAEAPEGVDGKEWLAIKLDDGAGRLEEARAEIERRFSVLKANAELILGYRPRDQIRAGALMLSAEESPTSALHYGKFLGGGVEAHVVDTDHYALLRPPHVQHVAELVRKYAAVGD